MQKYPSDKNENNGSNENLTSKTVRGIKWNSVSTITNAVVQLGFSVIMARILDPAAFGLMAMSQVVIHFGLYFAQMGMGQALIYKAELHKEDIKVAFTSSFLLGAIFFILAWLLAPFSVYIFDNPELVPVLRVTCLSLVLNGLNSTSTSLLRRRLEFKSLAIIQITSYIIGYVIVGISMALLGYGVWSLVYASICQSVLLTVISYIFARHSLVLSFKWEYYKPLFAFGSKMSFISFVDFLGTELDTLLIGRFLGESTLGLYNRATNLIRQPVRILVGTISRVLFPAFSRIQSEITRLKKVYLFSVSSVVLIIFPLCSGISLASKQIVLMMLGDKWAAAIPILQVLAFVTPFRVLMHFSGIVCDATGNLNGKAILHIVYFGVLGLLFLLFRPLGILGFTYALLLATIFKNYGYFLITRKILGLTFFELLKAYKPGLFSAAITSISIYLTSLILENVGLPNIIILFAEMAAGIIGWLISLYFSPDKTLLQNIISKFGGKLDNNSPIGQFLAKIS
jgi:lipopolysaccharide exporter